MREPSFTFTPAYQVQDYGKYTTLSITINTKNGQFRFSNKSPESQDLINKYVKTYVDKEKKTIAWTIFKDGEQSDLKHIRQIKEMGTANKQICFFDISPITALGIKNTGTKRKLDVNRYKPQGMLDKNEYFYVTL